MRTTLLAVVVSLALPSAAAADIVEECDANSNAEMTACIWQRYEALDKELNAVWKQALAVIDATGTDIMAGAERQTWRDSLTGAQRAWVKFKDEDCNGAVSYEWFGGSGANAAVGACLYEHTKARIDDLTARYLNR